MHEIWKRIDRWLEANAPDLLASLNPGASDQEIAETESFLGVTFPDDVRASYRIHNGQAPDQGGLIEACELLALEDIRNQWSVWKELLDAGDFADSRSSPVGPIVTDWWHPKWIPLTYDGSGNHHSLDLAPAPGGNVGQIIMMWHDDSDRPLIAPSFREWLGALADGLESGDYTYSDEYGGIMHRDDL